MATGRDLHIDVPLSNLAVKAFATGVGQFIAPQIMPIMPVDKESNKYYTVDKGNFLRIHDSKRSRKTKANRIEFDVSSDAYFAQEYALAGDIALQDLDNSDSALMLRQSTTDLVVSGLARDYERRVANTVTSISNVGSGVVLSGTDQWSDLTNSSPISDVSTGAAFMRSMTGLSPNVGIVDFDTLQMLRRHTEIIEFHKYTSGGLLSIEQIAAAFGLPRILVGTGIIENSLEGGTSSMTNIWGNNFVLAHINPAQGPRTATLGLSFRWRPSNFGTPMQVTRQQFRGAGTENIEVIEAAYHQDEKIIAADLGYAITATL